MRIPHPLVAAFALAACATPKDVYKGVHDGIEVSYRWSHPAGKPSELLLKLKNTSAEDRDVDLVIDLYYQGRTVESLMADTCIRSGQVLNGKLNGIWFKPEQLTTAQIKDGGANVEITRSRIEPTTCP